MVFCIIFFIQLHCGGVPGDPHLFNYTDPVDVARMTVLQVTYAVLRLSIIPPSHTLAGPRALNGINLASKYTFHKMLFLVLWTNATLMLELPSLDSSSFQKIWNSSVVSIG